MERDLPNMDNNRLPKSTSIIDYISTNHEISEDYEYHTRDVHSKYTVTGTQVNT